MKTYCLGCKKRTNNICSNSITMTNKVIRQKSRCANCMFDKLRFLKQNSNKILVGIILILNLSYTNHYKTC